MKQGYLHMLSWATGKASRGILAVTGVLVVVTLALFFTLGRSFLPPLNEGSFTINVSTLPGVSFARE